MHRCDIAADGSPDGSTDCNPYGNTNLVAHGCAYDGAHYGSDRRTNGVSDCSAFYEPHAVSDSSSMR